MDKIIASINSPNNDVYTIVNKLTIKQLEELIIYASDKYYNDEPVIEDNIFDMLRDILVEKKPTSSVLKEIGAPIKSKDKVELPYFLGSMDKIKPPSSKLDSWLKLYPAPYVLMDKEDGISGLLYYSNNTIKMYTRGTATHGMDISTLIQYIPNIPSYEVVAEYLAKNKMGKSIAIRGELIMSKKRFEKKWASTFKNARNGIGGLVNSKTINTKLASATRFVTYQIIEPNYNITKQLKILKELDFLVVHHKKLNTISYTFLSKYLLRRRTKSNYIIDGIIVTNDQIHPINTEGNPEYAFAFKDVLEDQKATSTVIDVIWDESKHGRLIPVIIIEPVEVGGVTIKRVTGNNARFIVDNNIGIGTTVQVIRSNDVIPKIEKVIKPTTALLPKSTNWKWNSTNIHIINSNDSDGRNIKLLYHFFSTLDAVGLGEKIIERIYNAGFTTIEQILKITQKDLLEIDGFKTKSADNIVASIKQSTTNIQLAKLMVASSKLGQGIGIERITDIINNYPDILTNYKTLTVEMLKKLDGWEDKTSQQFVTNLPSFIEFYNSIKKYVTIGITNIPVGNKMMGLKIVLSGFRNSELEEKIKMQGGVITTTISKNTSILVIKDNSIEGTSKVVKAKELGITIHTLDSFYKTFSFLR